VPTLTPRPSRPTYSGGSSSSGPPTYIPPENAIIPENGFTAVIPDQFAASWNVTPASKFEARLNRTPSPGKEVADRLAKIDAANTALLKELYKVSLYLNGSEMNKAVYPYLSVNE
jgi:hypothetical protein